MRKIYWIGPLLALILAATFAASVSSFNDRADGLILTSPSACPSGGCAAGQRLNFSASYSVTPTYSGNNTQVCIYAPTGWADFSEGWISAQGQSSGVTYTSGQIGSICSDNADGNEWVAGAYAQLGSGVSNDGLDFALNINSTASSSGQVIAKVFEADSGGSWSQTSRINSPVLLFPSLRWSTRFTSPILPPIAAVIHLASSTAGMISPTELGTGLRDAVMAQSTGQEIVILGNYVIKSESVLIDKALTISGLDDASISYSGSTCANGMLEVTAGAVIKDLAITDGPCTSPSRTLISIDSSDDVTIEHNTLNAGLRAVDIVDIGTGATVNVVFNHITNNSIAAVDANGLGAVKIYANNIIDNGGTYQVECNNNSTADHNFWGDNISAAASTSANCARDRRETPGRSHCIKRL